MGIVGNMPPAETGGGIVIGDIRHTAVPLGTDYLLCDGKSYLESAYPDLAQYFTVTLADQQPSTLLDMTDAGQSFLANLYEDVPLCLRIKSDGTRLWVIGVNHDELVQYDMTTAWDITTAKLSTHVDLTYQDGEMRGMEWNSDYTKLWLLGSQYDKVTEHAPASAGNTTSVGSATASFSPTAQAPNPISVKMNADASKMWITSMSSAGVHEYNLTTPGTLAGGVTFVASVAIAEDLYPYEIEFSHDNKRVWIAGYEKGLIYEYDLATAGTISGGMTYNGNSFAVAGVVGLVYNYDQQKMWTIASTDDYIRAYNLPSIGGNREFNVPNIVQDPIPYIKAL